MNYVYCTPISNRTKIGVGHELKTHNLLAFEHHRISITNINLHDVCTILIGC